MTTITILATGLLQPDPEWMSNGLRKAENAILKVNPKALILSFKWKQYPDIPSIAEKIAALWTPETKIVGGFHSYGGWFGALLFARLWDYYQIRTRAYCSADGVQHKHPKRGVLTISPGVDEVCSWYQTDGVLIRGSKIITTPPTKHTVHQQVHVGHARVDETPEFQRAVLEFATGGRNE